MKISVIVPVYNTERYLEQCVNSILSQTYKDIEIILVDDGSSDNSPKMCDEFAEKDSRVKVIHKKNGGPSDARNIGLQGSTGEYIVFLDSDDFYVDDHAIDNWIKKLMKFAPDILIFKSKKFYQKEGVYDIPRYVTVDENQIYEQEKILLLMKKGLFLISPWDKVISRKFLIENGIDFVLRQYSEDMEWCIKILYANPKICLDNHIYHAYRKQINTSLTANASHKAIVDISNVIKKYSVYQQQLSTNQLLVNNFIANIYVQWLNLSASISKKEISEQLKQMRKYQYLLRFNSYPYVNKVYKFRLVGFSILRRIIHCYYRLKNR